MSEEPGVQASRTWGLDGDFGDDVRGVGVGYHVGRGLDGRPARYPTELLWSLLWISGSLTSTVAGYAERWGSRGERSRSCWGGRGSPVLRSSYFPPGCSRALRIHTSGRIVGPPPDGNVIASSRHSTIYLSCNRAIYWSIPVVQLISRASGPLPSLLKIVLHGWRCTESYCPMELLRN